MLRLSVRFLPPFLFVAAAAQPLRAQEKEAASVRLLVPACFYPAGEGLTAWKRMMKSAAEAPIAAIVNPDSGPGKKADIDSWLHFYPEVQGPGE